MKNRDKLFTSKLSLATVTASGMICLYYFIYVILCLTGFDSLLMSLFGLFVAACSVLPIVLRDKLKVAFKRAYKPLKIVFCTLLWIYILTVIVFWCYIGLDSAKTPEMYAEAYTAVNDTGENTVVMVFGCRTYGYTPSKTLKLRLDAAYTLLSRLPDAMCVVSGGQGTNETVPEAEAMRAYLASRGIAEERIIMESDSHSTSENIRFTKSLLEEKGLSDKRIIGVSTAFHLPRIETLGARYGLEMETCASPSPTIGHHYVCMVREYLSYIKMLLFDEAVLITKLP